MAVQNKYSIWMAPDANSRMMLQSIINELADHLKAEIFVPHLTLVSKASANGESLEEIKTSVSILAQKSIKTKVSFAEYGYSDERFRALFLEADKSSLAAFFVSAEKLFPQIKYEVAPQMPHLSLLYGHYPQQTKEEIIHRYQIVPMEVTIEALELVLSKEPISSWQILESYPLDNQ